MKKLTDEEIRPVAARVRSALDHCGMKHFSDGSPVTDNDVWQIATMIIRDKKEK